LLWFRRNWLDGYFVFAARTYNHFGNYIKYDVEDYEGQYDKMSFWRVDKCLK
jgi:hypothetical protein